MVFQTIFLSIFTAWIFTGSRVAGSSPEALRRGHAAGGWRAAAQWLRRLHLVPLEAVGALKKWSKVVQSALFEAFRIIRIAFDRFVMLFSSIFHV